MSERIKGLSHSRSVKMIKDQAVTDLRQRTPTLPLSSFGDAIDGQAQALSAILNIVTGEVFGDAFGLLKLVHVQLLFRTLNVVRDRRKVKVNIPPNRLCTCFWLDRYVDKKLVEVGLWPQHVAANSRNRSHVHKRFRPCACSLTKRILRQLSSKWHRNARPKVSTAHATHGAGQTVHSGGARLLPLSRPPPIGPTPA